MSQFALTSNLPMNVRKLVYFVNDRSNKPLTVSSHAQMPIAIEEQQRLGLVTAIVGIIVLNSGVVTQEQLFRQLARLGFEQNVKHPLFHNVCIVCNGVDSLPTDDFICSGSRTLTQSCAQSTNICRKIASNAHERAAKTVSNIELAHVRVQSWTKCKCCISSQLYVIIVGVSLHTID